MPVYKCKGGGFKVANTKGKRMPKKKATKQLAAIKISQKGKK